MSKLLMIRNAALLLTLILLLPIQSSAQIIIVPPPPSDGSIKITASDGSSGDVFSNSRSIAIDGDTVVIGAVGDASNRGAAYVFVRDEANEWNLQAKLTASDPVQDAEFGTAVAIDGDTIVVGADGANVSNFPRGAAYVFTRSGSDWNQQAKLVAADGSTDDRFGGSVAIDSTTIIVGAARNDDAGDNTGAAYVFTGSGSNWNQQAKLSATDEDEGFFFGVSVAVLGDTALIGASGSDGTGAVYVFTRGGTIWTEQTKFKATDAETGHRFGSSIAISGNSAVIGANLDGFNTGAAYVFVGSGSNWNQQVKLTANDPVNDDQFGTSVAISGDVVVVGAPRNDDRGDNSGSAYVYRRNGTNWSQVNKLLAGSAEGDLLGESVAIDGNTAVVGAPSDNDKGDNSGAAYIYNSLVATIDANKDGNVSPADAIYIINRVGTDDLTADVNGDGIVTEVDLQAVLDSLGTPAR